MNYQEMSLFAEINPKYKLKGKVLLIELFAGIGATHRGLKLIEQAQIKQNVPLEDRITIIPHKICEWTYNSYVMYNLIHTRDFTDYSEGKTKEEMIERIKGTSTDYNSPLTMDQLNRKPIEWIKRAYNSCIATHNLVDISSVKGKDLDFEDNQNQTIIMTYSFPCQDISGAGNMKGLEKGTRSGLLWEVERILEERERERLPLPNILMLENVDMLLSQTFIKQFNLWEQKLASMGYSNFVKVLNSKDYGNVPQNRKRVFMISILGNYHYDFPLKTKLKYCLLDFCNKEVDDKYYLSDKFIECLTRTTSEKYPRRDRFIQAIRGGNDIGNCVTTRAGSRPTDNFLTEDKEQTTMLIKNKTKQGYLVGEEGDGIDIGSRMETHRGTVQKQSSQTILVTGGAERGVVVKKNHE